MNRKPSKSFKDLVVWQKSHEWVLSVYDYTEAFPRKEMFGLTSQLRRSAISVPANIAEGFKKRGKPDKRRFMNIAQGSLEESRYYLILAQDLNYGNSSQVIKKLEEVSKLIEAYNRAILNSEF
ncbi:MAG: four helix bundle protein [Bacteroidales bacterium]